MRKLYSLFLFFLIFCSTISVSKAQQFLSLRGSNYAGIYNVYYNPAEIVDSRYTFDLNLVSFSGSFTNDFGTLNRNYFFDKGFLKLNVKDDMDPYLSFAEDSKMRSGLGNTTIFGPSFMFTFGKTRQYSFGLFTKANAFVNVDGVSGEFSTLAKDDFKNDALQGKPIVLNNFQTSAIGYGEIGATFGRVLFNKEQNFLKGAVSVKYVRGYASAYINSKQISMQVNDPENGIAKITTDLSIGHSNNFDPNTGDFQSDKIGGSASAAFDLGLVYEFRPKYRNFYYEMDQVKDRVRQDVNKYMFKAAISVTDIGGPLKFEKGNFSRDYKINRDNYDLSGLPDPTDLKEFTDYLDADFGNQGAKVKNYEFNLPTALNANFDYHVWRGIYLNANAYVPMNNKSKVSAHYVNMYSFTPRVETGNFGVYFPVTYSGHQDLNMGFTLRLGTFIIGTNTIAPVFGKEDIKAADIHFGVRIPVTKKHPRDRDNDLISDRKDKCKRVPGEVQFWGCPDTDKDGIQDKEDKCPEVAGKTEFGGCPDTDNDGIQDSEDKCPTVAGKAEFGGCPDTDNDGVVDSEDKCPNVAGKKEFGGCPDTDNDGIIDSEDKCPELAGPKELGGCPDTDGDGIVDPQDKCPTEKGLPELNGCPQRDADGDGVKDEVDACPTVAGPVENKGCPYPDTDGDSVLDKDDQCPNTPGDPANHGCPVIEEETKKILEKAFDNLEFTTGKAIIKKVSFASLTDLALIMKENPDYILKIEGHTDNVGKRATNMLLSKNRANAVKNYLVKKGVAANQFKVNSFGPDKPIADNATAEGRQQNRRVEMTVIFK
ncbi:hypothetical protein C3K47_15760 [Solitalea longa]|uniref:OmpA-like domain-containing protein n=1 Tax=Solitalea longa TaxID=2079460 RepID=A0A2S4ZYW7_9SPHI|nr:thrombospondin type 3 repeat-containing protein [Solitalea longa]POY35239.1 hypothetical protein C3K47_15760 [Solitalea longa]